MPRRFRDRASRTSLLFAALISITVSAVMLSPFMNVAHLGSALHVGDGRVQAWVLAWVAHALTTGASLFDANMFYPAPASLAHTDSMVALGVLATPVWLVTGNAILAFNVLQWLGPSATSFTTFLLLRRWTGDWLASLVGGLTFGLSFFALLHNAHLNLTWAAGLPLSMLLLERWWRQPTWPALTGLWLVVVFTALTSWYLAVMLAVLLAIHGIWLAVTMGRLDLATRGPQILAAGALSVAVLLPFLAPYLGRGSEAGEAAALAADVRSYLVPPENTLLGHWLVGRGLITAQSIWGESTLYLGWATVLLAGTGLTTALRSNDDEMRARAWLLLALLATGVSLSFGPSPTGLAPYDILALLPGVRGVRATARFAILACLACSLLAGFGLAAFRRVAPRAAVAIMLGLGAVMMLERFVINFPPGRPQPEAMPEIYAHAHDDGAAAAIVLPIYAGMASWFHEGDYLLYSTRADFLPLANGIGRWVPPEYLAMGQAMADFPSPASAAALRVYGITHVVLHSARFGDQAASLVARARSSPDYVVVNEWGSDVLLRVRGDSPRASRERQHDEQQ